MLVGRIACEGGGQQINVEIVLHVKRLFEQKKQVCVCLLCVGVGACICPYLCVHSPFRPTRPIACQLHLLYEARKGLDADAASTHEGALTLEVAQRATRGIVRTIKAARSAAPIDDEVRHQDSHTVLATADLCTPLTVLRVLHDCVCVLQVRDALCEMLRGRGVALFHLELSGSDGLQGVELGRGMLLRPLIPGDPGGELAPTRLRVLMLAGLGLVGHIPPELSRAVWLKTLELQNNALDGPVPAELGTLHQLETLALHANALSGEVPALELTSLTKLSTLTLGGDAGGNAELSITRSGESALRAALAEAELHLPTNVTNDDPPSPDSRAAGAGSAKADAAAGEPSADVERLGVEELLSEAPTGGEPGPVVQVL